MAITKAQVDQWFIDNPKADAQLVADTIKSAGGLTNELAGLLAARYETSPEVISQTYQSLVPQAAQPTAKPAAQPAASKIIKDYQGISYPVDTLRNLASQLSGITDTSRLSGGAFNTNKSNIGFAYEELAGGLDAKPTTFDQVLMDAARGLYNQGITDLSQVKVGDISGDTDAYPEMSVQTGDKTGRYYVNLAGTSVGDGPPERRLLTPEETARITEVADEVGNRTIVRDVVSGKGLYLGDKLLSPNLGLSAGETYTGDGSTNYGIDFTSGKPQFVTGGASSNFFDTGLGQLSLIAGSVLGAPYLSEALGGLTGLTGSNLAAATGATIGGTTSALTGQDPLKGALVGGAGAYAGATLGDYLSTTGTGVNLGTATGADMDAFYDMGPVQSGGGVNLGTATGADLDAFYDAGVGSGQIDLGGGITINADGSISGGTFNGANGSLMGMDSATAIATGLKNPPTSLLPGNLTVTDVVKALPLVPVVNQLVGDPLGLNKTPEVAPTTPTGFGIVPIPESWKPPTYTQSTGGTGGAGGAGGFTPIDLNSIFTNQNLLTGTQWQGLPNQRNVTFNDIFAAGQQQTPTGTPVNLNNIVSAILGQTATSQKSA